MHINKLACIYMQVCYYVLSSWSVFWHVLSVLSLLFVINSLLFHCTKDICYGIVCLIMQECDFLDPSDILLFSFYHYVQLLLQILCLKVIERIVKKKKVITRAVTMHHVIQSTVPHFLT